MRAWLGFLSLTICLFCLSGLAAAEPEASSAAREHFARRVWPLLAAKCLACHGEDEEKREGGLDMRTREALLKGGDLGEPSIVPHAPEKSWLYLAVTREHKDLVMPPKENDKLTEAEVAVIKQWIESGAPWGEMKPLAENAWDATEGITVATSGGLSDQWNTRRYEPDDLWAWRPVASPAVPVVKEWQSKLAHPIDAFIAAKLSEQGVHRPAPPADKRTLIRRVTFDLTGMPPTPEEVAAFIADEREDAYERLIDRLLDSPHYGEQQARHYFDVVRYADTSGFSNDYERPNAWRYRDYVIRSFNADKPYDRFITEQLAGDELDADDPELLIATGFLRLGPWEHTGMTVAAVTRQQFLDDVTHHVGVSFLGQGLRCASCHDHKFDPIPTRDYYRLQAVFATTHFAERPAKFLPVENTENFAKIRAAVEERLRLVRQGEAALKRKNQEAIAAYLAERGVKSVEELPEKERPPADYLGGTFGLTKQDLSLRKIYNKYNAYLQRELLRCEPQALAVYCGPSNNYNSNKTDNGLPPLGKQEALPVVQILTGGALESPGETVSPGVLSAQPMWSAAERKKAEALTTDDKASIPTGVAGRRLALAAWITSRENPLTARVLVNRLWQQHFGRGIVATPNNFGKMAAKPTHPELLDYLATRLMQEGWSLKKLHRLIVTSATYRQSGEHPERERLQEVDAGNTLLAYYPPRRLAGEELRDAMLAISGELNRTAGGPGNFPELNWEVALQPRHIMGSVAPAYLPSRTPQERHRRTIYAFRYRTLSDPLLEVLNRPGSETSCERRDATTVTPQVFALFNSEFAASRALALAARLSKEHPGGIEERLAAAFRLTYGRAPTKEELAACRAHVQAMTEHHRAHPPREEALPLSVERQMVEELTGETVVWDEDLSILKEYQRDLMPWQTTAEVRALADVCLVLLNSNEFLYVY